MRSTRARRRGRSRDALEAVDRPQDERGAQPERQRPQHALAIDPRSRRHQRAVDRPRWHWQLLVGVAESVVPGRCCDQGARITFAGGAGARVGGGAVGAPRWRPTPPLGSAHARVPGQGRIGRVTAALGWGALAASSLVIGALLGMARDWPPRLVGLVLAFGAGALISAVSFDLAEEGARLGDAGVVAGGLAAGAITYFALDRVVGRRSASRGGGAGARAPPSRSARSSTASRSRRSSASGSRRARGSASGCSSRSSSRTCRRRSGRPARCTPPAPGRRRSAACGSSSR